MQERMLLARGVGRARGAQGWSTLKRERELQGISAQSPSRGPFTLPC